MVHVYDIDGSFFPTLCGLDYVPNNLVYKAVFALCLSRPLPKYSAVLHDHLESCESGLHGSSGLAKLGPSSIYRSVQLTQPSSS